MSAAESARDAGRSATTYFVLALAFVVMAGVSSPLFLVAALGFIAAGFTTRRAAQDIVFGALLIAFVGIAFAYSLGKDLAQRDNARAAPSSADGA